MARRYNFDFAGQSFGFNLPTVTEENGETKTESVLSDYFPELKLSFSPKTQRGGRLGRAATQMTPEVTMRQKEAATLGGGGPISISPTFTNTFTPQVTAPTAPVVQQPVKPQRAPISTAYGASEKYFGHEDYFRNLEAGYTPAELKEYIQNNQQLLNPESTNVQGKGGLYDQIMQGNVLTGYQQPAAPQTPQAPQAPQPSARESSIQDIYKNVLGREADVGGLQHYAGSSMSTEDIRRDIEQSPEKKEQQLNTLYREVLGRDADPSGIQTYTREDPRAEGGFTKEELESLKQTLLSSAEYKAKNP